MTAALTPGREYVSIMNPVVFEAWHGRKGLHCLGCNQGLTVVLSKLGNPYLRHEPGDSGRRSTGDSHSGEETYLHNRAKYWVRDRLRALGMADAEVEQQIGNQVPDVSGHYRNQSFAVEVQWSPLAETSARQRTAGLTGAGVDHIVWLTYDCDWATRLPALGIIDFDPHDDEYQALTGFYRAHSRGTRETRSPVSSFLQQWINGELAWAHVDLSRRGWATVTDWEQRTLQQARTITGLQIDLDGRNNEITELRGELATKTTEADTKSETLKKAVMLVEGLKKNRDELTEKNKHLSALLAEETSSLHTAAGIAGVVSVVAVVLLVLLIVL